MNPTLFAVLFWFAVTLFLVLASMLRAEIAREDEREETRRWIEEGRPRYFPRDDEEMSR